MDSGITFIEMVHHAILKRVSKKIEIEVAKFLIGRNPFHH